MILIVCFVTLFSILAVYVCCDRPAWTWTMFVSTTVLINLVGELRNVDVSSIPFGPVTLRASDPALLGVLVGLLYHLHHDGAHVFRHRPLVSIMGAILAFFLVKVAWTVVIGQDQIAANPTASHALGGVVAAVGELRDVMVAFLLPLYAYAARRSYNLRALGVPILMATCLILAKAFLMIAITHQIWSDDANYRYISAQEAITLTIFSFLLYFLPAPRWSSGLRRPLSIFALMVALIANHRSQWLGAAAGLVVLTAVVLFGRPFVGDRRLNRLVASGTALLVVLGAALLSTLKAIADRLPIVSTLTVRLYAITQPSKDADAQWREAIWHDRIRQVGSDWPWGRLLGDRRATLLHGQWLSVPDHSAYVEMYELGGAILCVLIGLFWARLIYLAWRQSATRRSPQEIWPAAVCLAICATSLAFGSGYDFPVLGPSLSLLLLLGSERSKVRASTPLESFPAWTNRAGLRVEVG